MRKRGKLQRIIDMERAAAFTVFASSDSRSHLVENKLGALAKSIACELTRSRAQGLGQVVRQIVEGDRHKRSSLRMYSGGAESIGLVFSKEATKGNRALFLVGDQADADILRHMIFAVGSTNDIFVVSTGLLLGIDHRFNQANNVGSAVGGFGLTAQLHGFGTGARPPL